jgi:lambda repressor-like predicted transcriptional regulator
VGFLLVKKKLEIDHENHARIKYLLSLSGSTFSDVAKSLSISVSTVCSASVGRYRSSKVEHEIARRTGLPVAELWPGRTTSITEETVK